MDTDNKETTVNLGELKADSEKIRGENEGDADENNEGVLGEQPEEAEVKTVQSEGQQNDGDKVAECADENTQQQDNNELQVFVDDLLKEKITFNTGEEEFIFSRGPKYSNDMWPLTCHVCRKGNFVTLMQIKNHVKGTGHRGRLVKVLDKPQAHQQYMRPFRQNPCKDRGMLTPIIISPGEVIGELTEEHKDKIIKDFQIQQPPDDVMKEADIEPMHEYNKKLPLIGLCYLYRMQVKDGNIHYYCLLCSMNLTKKGFKHVTSQSHQFKYIERHFPKLYAKVVQRLQKEPSIDFNTCVINIFRKLYRKIENGKGFKEILFVDHSHFYKYKYKYLNNMFKFVNHYDENTILITQHEVDILIRKCISRMEFIKPDHKMPGKSQRENKGKHMKRVLRGLYNNEEAAWQRYHFIMKRELEDLNQDYQNFDRNPNSHPAYFNEERTFFSRAGNDTQNLRNLKREWIPYWRRRLRYFYDSELAKRKLRVKAELRLRTDIRTPSPMCSPNERVPSNNIQSSSGYHGGYTEGATMRPNVIDTQSSSEPLGVISVLRLFTTLQDQLGTMGPKAVEFLSKALLAEKSNQNSNDLMMSTDVYVFFITAKEKLKGQIYANIVDEYKVPTVSRAISDTTTLLDMFDDYSRRTGKYPTLSLSTTPIHQFDSINTAVHFSPNQFASTTQSDSYKTNISIFQSTNDNNDTSNRSNQGGLKNSGLNLNPYQTGLGSTNINSSSRGNGGNNCSTQTMSSSQYQTSGIGNQYSGGKQYDTNSNKNDSFGSGLGDLQRIGCTVRNAPNSFGTGSRNFQRTEYSSCNTPNSFGVGSGNSFSSTLNSFGARTGKFQRTGYSARRTPRKRSRNFQNY